MSTFKKIYDSNYRAMYRVAQKMLNDREQAFDVVQDVFLSLFDKLKSGRVINNPGGWLYSAICYKCIDYHRKRRHFEPIETLNNVEAPGDRNHDLQEQNAIVYAAIARLKSKEKMLLVLYSEGLTYREISQATGINLSSIGKMISRALIKLKKQLKLQHHEV